MCPARQPKIGYAIKLASNKKAACPQRSSSFFESPHGLEFLHRLLCALHLVVGQANDGGIRNICWLLELCQLDRFIAVSYGAQQKVAASIERSIEQFGQEEQARLAVQMPHREITLCEDETFHPQICLVAIEPVSNFLILEQYAAKRDAPTWNAAVDEALKPFSVTVIQCVSDQATALIAHTEIHLGVHHSPDLFHVQHETSRATSVPLHRQTEKAEKAFKDAEASHQENVKKLNDFNETWPCSLKQLELDKELKSHAPVLEKALSKAREEFETTQARQRRAREARCGIGQDYHPIDLKSGAPIEAFQAQVKLNAHFDTLDQVATEAGLRPSSFARIAKAKRVLPSMIATLVFFWTQLAIRAASLKYSQEVVQVWLKQLVAGYYLAEVAQRCSDSKERKRLVELSRTILEQAKARDGPLSALNEKDILYLEEQARLASELFQRSSSCVEGRNGQLSLRHHGLREITTRKLRVLGVLHNYVIKRSDGSTAATRFFGQKHRELFPWLVEHMPLPTRPRRKARS